MQGIKYIMFFLGNRQLITLRIRTSATFHLLSKK